MMSISWRPWHGKELVVTALVEDNRTEWDDIHAHVLRRTCTVHSHLHTIMAISFFCALFCGWVCQSCSELTHYSPASVCYFAWRLIDSRNWVFAFSINHHDSTTALTSQPWQVVATEGLSYFSSAPRSTHFRQHRVSAHNRITVQFYSTPENTIIQTHGT